MSANTAPVAAAVRGGTDLALPPQLRELRQELLETDAVDGAVRLGTADRRQRGLRFPNRVQQCDGIEPLAAVTQLLLGLPAHGLVRQQPLARCRRRQIALRDPRAVACLLGQLERRLEEVHVQPHGAVQLGKRLPGDRPRVAVVAHEPTHHRAVLLLDPRLVVLAVGPGTGELDAAVLAVRGQRLVEKRRVVVGIDARIATGSCCAIAPTPWTTTDCSRTRSGTASVHPEQTSVATRLWMKDPVSRPPQWATKSTSRKPGNGSPQSENVRTGTRALSFLFRRRLRREPASLRTGARRRSIVAALTVSTRLDSDHWNFRARCLTDSVTQRGSLPHKDVTEARPVRSEQQRHQRCLRYELPTGGDDNSPDDVRRTGFGACGASVTSSHEATRRKFSSSLSTRRRAAA